MLQRILVLFLLVTIGGCTQPVDFHASEYIFGTRVDIQIFGVPEKQAQSAAEQVFIWYRQLHHSLHAWQPGDLVMFNEKISNGESAQTTPEILELIKLSQEYEASSGGLFNPAIGRLIALWGFHSDIPGKQPPSPEQIKKYTNHMPTMADYQIRGNTVTSSNPDDWLDFGGIAKGWAVDKGVEMLKRSGIKNAIINAGGDLKGIGVHGERAWKVGVRDPKGGVLAALEVGKNEAIFTSGNYERFYLWNGQRYHHIIDPRSGYPAQQTASVTVLEHNSAKADAAATALLIAGEKNWRHVAQSMGIDSVLIVTRDGKIQMTPSMQRRIQLVKTSQTHSS